MSSPHTEAAQISVIIPCFNEEAVLPALFARLTAAAESWSRPWEMIAVDDGSRDATWALLVAQNQRDPRWKAISFTRNFGQQIAVSAGLFHATGEAMIVIDADLQDPPEELHRFIAKWREGFEVVYAVRTKRKESGPKRFCYWLFYRSLAKVSKSPVPLDSGDFCLMDRKVVEAIKAMPERNRFIRGLRAWAGFRQIGLSYERHGRAAGEIKHTLSSLMGLALDGIFSFSTVPLRLASYLGFLVSGIALLGVIFTFAQRIFREWFASIGLGPVPGFATIVISILFLGGIQLICVGILGEYLGRVYDEVKRRPTWLISKGAGVTPQAPPL